MNTTIIPPALEERLTEMERGPIGIAQEARRLRQHLLTCPKCIEEMTNNSTDTPRTDAYSTAQEKSLSNALDKAIDPKSIQDILPEA